MKLLHCNYCGDVFTLGNKWKTCRCGKSQGKYINKTDAQYKGDCIPLGFENNSFSNALTNQPETGQGKDFVAFVIPKECPTIKKMDLGSQKLEE